MPLKAFVRILAEKCGLEKAGPVLDLYEGLWQGDALSPGDFVLCADEKTSIQARRRCHPTLPPGPGDPMRGEHT
jgi:hypothetical protein